MRTCLDAIFANPHDDLPRLVYADWLKVLPIAATADDLRTLARSEVARRLKELHLWVQFPDGSREDLRARDRAAPDEITAFVREHAATFGVPSP